MDVIFIAGIHGVGKTTASQELSRKLGIKHLTASGIIKAESSSALEKQSKLVADVEKNQQLLINGLMKYTDNQRVILDGHFTLRRQSDGVLERIPADLFRSIGVIGIILFVDSVEKIVDRLLARDGTHQAKIQLQLHQEEEEAQARRVSAELQIPLVVILPSEITRAARQISAW